MQLIEDIKNTFTNIQINLFDLKDQKSKDFWFFLKDQKYKGIYLFFNKCNEDVSDIIYVGKAGRYENNKRTVYDRTQNYFYNRKFYPNSPLNSEGKFEFKKLNRLYKQHELIFEKDYFKMITILIKEDKTISPELLESFVLNKLLKEYNHYPKFNNKI